MKLKLIQLILLICFSLVVMAFSDSCGGCGDPEVCFTMKPESCPGADLAGTAFHVNKHVKKVMWLNPMNGNISPYQTGSNYVRIETWSTKMSNAIYAVVENNTIKNKYVEGYEINYGFWSKDSYRKYTYEEMFEWKYGRKPTPTELANITCNQVKSWFNERHTVERGWPLSDDPPRDVKCKEQPYTKYCTTIGGNETRVDGEVEFPDGTRCKIKDIDLERADYNPCDNPHNVEIELEDNCNKCN